MTADGAISDAFCCLLCLMTFSIYVEEGTILGGKLVTVYVLCCYFLKKVLTVCFQTKLAIVILLDNIAYTILNIELK